MNGPGPCIHYNKPLGSFPILGGVVELPIIHDMQRKGRSSADPFGILPGGVPCMQGSLM